MIDQRVLEILVRQLQGRLANDTVRFPVAVTAASVPNNTLFRDSADNKLKFKDNGGVVNALY